MKIGSFRFNLSKKEQDPVCLMKVKIEDSAICLDYEGKIYYFCSQNCKNEFYQEPEKYL